MNSAVEKLELLFEMDTTLPRIIASCLNVHHLAKYLPKSWVPVEIAMETFLNWITPTRKPEDVRIYVYTH